MINADAPGRFRGSAPYWRLALFKDRGQDNFLVGKATSLGAPWAKVRLGIQYTGYNRFNGASRYVDDAGNDRRAKGNNTWFLFVWTAI